MPKPSLRRINQVLFGAIILVNTYTICMPFVPQLQFWYTAHLTHRQQQLKQLIQAPVTHAESVDRAGRRLIIPAIGMDQDIHEVPSTRTIRNDVWRRPNTSTPDKGGNTVLVGHRFTYTNPTGVFYNLDKIKIGDQIALTWNNKRYVYTVANTRVVKPTVPDVETPTTDNRLTLYTCTPLWNPKQRLVVIANLEHIL